MSTAALAGRPPSPPHSADGDIGPSDNKQSTIQREPYTPPRSIRPALSAETCLVSSSPGDREPQLGPEENLPAQDYYGDPSMFQTAPSHSYYPTMQPTFVRTMPMQYHTPPTAFTDTGIQTRSGRALGSPLSPNSSEYTRHTSSPRPKKATRNAKAGKSKVPLVEQPLSVLTADYKLPVKDMHAWVHRPLADRVKEIDKKKGYISRPMNSFMLYRSAYADRVKQFCKENNHQVVSQVTGASWPLEPKEIREMYESYAMIERDNHHAAHPDYKFAPNKNGKKRARIEGDASDDDPDWKTLSRTPKRSRTSRRGDTTSQSSTPFEVEKVPRHHMLQYHPSALHPSSYQAVNPGAPTPMMIGPNGLFDQYYQTTVAPYGQHVHDVKFEKMENPFQRFETNPQLVGLPNSDHHDLLTSQPSGMMPVHMQGEMLDPRLAHYDPNLGYPQYENIDPAYPGPQHYEYASYAGQPTAAYPQEFNYHPGMVTLTDGRKVWSEPEQVGSAFDEEFQRWN